MPDLLVPHKRIPWRHLVLFGWLPSPLKVWAYRVFLGYRIGRRVKFGFGGVVVGEAVDLGDHVEIGFLAIVMGRRITIGRHSSVGTTSYLSCEVIEIGEDARIREQVYVGGPQLPESLFRLGSRTIVLQMAFINPTKPVIIGDDTGIGGHCLIFTHSAWLNVLDGYPVTYAPVTLGKSVWLPWRVFIMPGTTVGDGAVIGANSLASGTIPAFSLAVGSPARVIKQAPEFPLPLSPTERSAKIEEMISEFDRYLRHEGVAVEEEGPFRLYRRHRKRSRLLRLRAETDLPATAAGDTVLAERTLSAEELTVLRDRGTHWLDVGGRSRSREGSSLTEELALFLARYGIRLPRD
jgi:acetyltransferase-like isoleucine patch superfamily enzyme